ncbi:hypothetical protein Tco_1156776 [Tanacetum coccineum]
MDVLHDNRVRIDGLIGQMLLIWYSFDACSYTCNMCMQSWGNSSYARAMIEFRAHGELKDTIVVFLSCKIVISKSNIDVLNSVKNDDDLGTNGVHSKSAGNGPNSDVFPSDHGFFNVTSSSTSTTPIVERIDKIERKIIDGKLTLVDDDEKPLPKVVSTAKYG